MSENKTNNIEQAEQESNNTGEWFEHYRFEVDKGQSSIRIDKFLAAKMENTSRSKIQTACDAQCVLVNKASVKANYKVKGGDSISIVLPTPPHNFEIIPEDIPLDIVYEDEHVLVLNKPAGLVVHPGYGNYTGTLVNGLAHYLKDSELFQTDDLRPGLVHRIDKNTSGLLVVAKTEVALKHLSKQFYDHTTERKYLALVWGSFEEKEGSVSGYLARDLQDRLKMHVYQDESEGKWSLTHYKVLENLAYVSLIECQLETGRTHQIRVHMEHIKHPLFNDERYGGDKILRGTTFSKYKQFVENVFRILPRHALHAKTLGFTHPVTEERLFFESELPQDMEQAIAKWRHYIAYRNDII